MYWTGGIWRQGGLSVFIVHLVASGKSLSSQTHMYHLIPRYEGACS